MYEWLTGGRGPANRKLERRMDELEFSLAVFNSCREEGADSAPQVTLRRRPTFENVPEKQGQLRGAEDPPALGWIGQRLELKGYPMSDRIDE